MENYKEFENEKQRSCAASLAGVCKEEEEEEADESPNAFVDLSVLFSSFDKSEDNREKGEILEKMASGFAGDSALSENYDFFTFLMQKEISAVFGPQILHLFSCVIDANQKNETLEDFFFQNVNSVFIDQLLCIEKPHPQPIDYNAPILENKMLVFSICSYLLSKSKITKFKHTVFWCDFNPFLIQVLSLNEGSINAIVFKTLSNVISGVKHMQSTYVNNGIPAIAFSRIVEVKDDFAEACSLLGRCIDYPFSCSSNLPPNWPEILGDAVLSLEQNAGEHILRLLCKMAKSSIICNIMFESGLHDLLFSYSSDAPFSHRKLTLEIVMEIFADENNNRIQSLVDYILEKQSLEMFVPFLETEDIDVVSTVTKVLSQLVCMARVSEGYTIPPIFTIFANSGELMEMIEEISHNIEDPRIEEEASFIITEMEGNIETAERIQSS